MPSGHRVFTTYNLWSRHGVCSSMLEDISSSIGPAPPAAPVAYLIGSGLNYYDKPSGLCDGCSGAGAQMKPMPASHPQDALVHEGVSTWENPVELLQTSTDDFPEQIQQKTRKPALLLI
ncbi:hypothetical protein EYF80_034175 [Liparis tanakae]|uniref:Uncharacterized protein n=1 Tax=Liparis tanakae TaxID=230148 RepID=A0A4Z2GPI0_9TELE|nr:hypothetical protein EYF80_034175 [Liparis tanakae]